MKRVIAMFLAGVILLTSVQIPVRADEVITNLEEDEVIEEENADSIDEVIDDVIEITDEDDIIEVDDSTEEPLLGANADQSKIHNPRSSNGTVTWDCVYFGNYWQNDTNGDGTADKNDAKEKIKWRVLSVDGDDAFLIADQNLDSQIYNVYTDEGCNWKTCTIRSWLNGYGSSSNAYGKDYSDSDKNFMDTAFTSSEQDAIIETTLANADNPEYGTEGGDDTQDKIFLLSYDDAVNNAYGFASDYSKKDEARWAKNTAYAKAAGAWTASGGNYAGNGWWWLRSPGAFSGRAMEVYDYGYVDRYGHYVDSRSRGVRPALHLNLSSSLWSYAETVSSKGDIVEPPTPEEPEEPEEEDINHILVPYNNGDYESAIVITSYDKAFNNDSINFDKQIADYSIGLSTLVYASDKNINKGFEKLGFAKPEYIEDDTVKKDHSGTGEKSPFYISYRNLSEIEGGYTLIAVAIRGTFHEEWINNFAPELGDTHKGFENASKHVFTNMMQYIYKHNLQNKKIKLLITGHSRGAATANLVGQYIDDSITENSIFQKNNVYVYTFATPNVSINGRYEGYENIFNIVNPEDFVTKVMLSQWGYKRYGKTYVLPSKTTDIYEHDGYVDYDQFLRKVKMWVKKDSGLNYNPYTLGTLTVSTYVTTIFSQVLNVNQYYNKLIGSAGTLHNLYKYGLGYLLSDNTPKKIVSAGHIASALSGSYGMVGLATMEYFIKEQFIDKDFEMAHRPETYLEMVCNLKKNQLMQKRGSLFGIVNCPVDVTIKDENGEVIGLIENNIVDNAYGLSSNMNVIGDSKTFMIPDNQNYTIELTGNGSGTMDYSLCKVDPDTGESERIYYEDVPLADGIEYECSYDESVELSNQILTDESNNEIAITEHITEDNLDNLSINVEVQGVGSASSYSNVTRGDYVVLSAMTDENNEFLGWYDEDGRLISTESEYGISVEENMDFVAKFTNNIVPASGIVFEKDTIYMQVGDVDYNKASLLPVNATATQMNYVSEDESVVEVDDSGIITAIKDGIAYINAETLDKKVTNKYKVVVGNWEPTTEWLSNINKVSDTEYVLNLAAKEKYSLDELKKEKADGKQYKIIYDKVGKKSDSQYAAMTAKGLITAKKAGVSHITLNKSGVEYKITVNVFNPQFTYANPKAKYFTVNTGETVIPTYDACKLKPTFTLDKNAIKKGLATINPDTGEVTPLKKGNVKVTATVGGEEKPGYARKVTTTVRIYDPVIYTGKKSEVKVNKVLKASVKNGVKGTNDWKSSDEAIATVDKNGRIRGIAPGVVTISCTNNGKPISKEITVIENPRLK